MPGPKKGSVAVRGAPLTKMPGYAKLPGKAERYRSASGETISKREYLARARAYTYFEGARVSNERFAALRRMVEEQVRRSTSDLPIADKRALAFEAAARVVNRPRSRVAQNEMFDILRNDLEYDDPDTMIFWYHDDEVES